MADLYYALTVRAGPATAELSRELTSIDISEQEGTPDLLVVQMSDPFKVYGHALQEGMEVEVDLGTVEDHSLVFRGRIHQVDASFPEDGVPTVTLRAHDNAMRMGLRARNRPWTETTLSGIARDIAREHGFMSQDIQLLGDPSFSGNGVRQHAETDLAFLNRLAGEFGAELWVEPADAFDRFVFRAQREIMTAEPSVTLHHGRCGVPDRLLSFDARADLSEVQLPRELVAIDEETGEESGPVQAPVEEVAPVEDPFFDENMTAFRARHPDRAARLEALVNAGPMAREEAVADLGSASRPTSPTFQTPERLQTRAENQFSTRVHGMTASGSTTGNRGLHAQSNVEIADVGARFSGIWYLARVHHVLDGAGYRTDFEARR
jgi:phage protein D